MGSMMIVAILPCRLIITLSILILSTLFIQPSNFTHNTPLDLFNTHNTHFCLAPCRHVEGRQSRDSARAIGGCQSHGYVHDRSSTMFTSSYSLLLTYHWHHRHHKKLLEEVRSRIEELTSRWEEEHTQRTATEQHLADAVAKMATVTDAHDVLQVT